MDGQERQGPNIEGLFSQKDEAELAFAATQRKLIKTESFTEESAIELGVEIVQKEMDRDAATSALQRALGKTSRVRSTHRVKEAYSVMQNARVGLYDSLRSHLLGNSEKVRRQARKEKNPELNTLATQYYLLATAIPTRGKPHGV